MIMDSGFCVLKGLSETRKMGFYSSVSIKRGTTGLEGLFDTVLNSNLGQKLLLMWDFLVVSGMI